MKLHQMKNMLISLNTTANVLDMIKHGCEFENQRCLSRENQI